MHCWVSIGFVLYWEQSMFMVELIFLAQEDSSKWTKGQHPQQEWLWHAKDSAKLDAWKESKSDSEVLCQWLHVQC